MLLIKSRATSQQGVLWIITSASIASQFGAGLIWSGLPHYAASSTRHYALYGLLFVISSLSGIVTPMLGGLIPTRISNVSIAVTSSIGTAACYLWIANLSFASQSFLIALVLLISSILAALSAPAFADLLSQAQKAAYNGDLEAGSGHYQTFVMVAKMTGFSLGPLAFAQFGPNLLYIIALGYSVEAAIMSHVPSQKSRADGPKNEKLSLWSIWEMASRHKGYLAVALLNGILSFPLIAFALYMLTAHHGAGAKTITVFWIATSAVSVLVNFTISRGMIAKVGRKIAAVLSSLSVFLAAAATFYAPMGSWLIVGFCFFTLGNPLIGAITRNLFFHAEKPNMRRRLFGLLQTATAIGVAIGVSALTGADTVLLSFSRTLSLGIIGLAVLARMMLVVQFVHLFENSDRKENGAPA